MQIKRRTILPDTRGPNPESLSQDVQLVDGEQRTCAQWTSKTGESALITVLGSPSSTPGVDKNDEEDLSLGIQAIAEYRVGGIARRDTWVWQTAGWRRVLLASQVAIYARRVSVVGAPASAIPIQVGAGISRGACQPDELVLRLANPAAGVVPRMQKVPIGTSRFRLWDPTGLVVVSLGWVDAAGVYGADTDFPALTAADAADWSNWPTGCNAIQVESENTAYVQVQG